ncbi:ABC transporter substrate-binding protein, partial [Candidatus Desantisbacteria bacterium]|nr:ABC transporter substrate-binding protein [Candidatus Desantisbacteria bacterium]
ATETNVKISIPSKKIVSLSPGIFQGLYALEKGDDIIAVTDDCSHLPQIEGKERVGDRSNISIEKLIRLSPELVLSIDGDIPEQTITNLRDIGITVFVLKKCITIEDIQENFRFLGKITKSQAEAELNIAEANKRMDAVAKRIKDPKPRVFWEIGAKPLTTVGRGTYADTIIRLGGGENIVSGKTKSPFYTMSAVVRNNPDVIILSNVPDEENFRWKQIESISASQSNRIYPVDPGLINISTPLALAEAVEKVSRLIYP